MWGQLRHGANCLGVPARLDSVDYHYVEKGTFCRDTEDDRVEVVVVNVGAMGALKAGVYGRLCAAGQP